ETEVIDGIETYVLKSRGKYGEHKVWLDPAHGGLPRRIEIHKLPGNFLDDEQLGTPPALRPGRTQNEDWTLIDKIQIQKQKDVFVMRGYESAVSLVFADVKNPREKTTRRPTGPMTELRFRVEVDPREFPADAFRFAVEIPNGTPLLVEDNLPLRYQGPDK